MRTWTRGFHVAKVERDSDSVPVLLPSALQVAAAAAYNLQVVEPDWVRRCIDAIMVTSACDGDKCV